MESSPLRIDCRICMNMEVGLFLLLGLGLIVGWFWCRVYGISCGLNWEDIVAGEQGLFRDGFGSKTGVYRSCQGILWHAGAWKPRRSMAGCILGYAIAWDSTL